MVPNMMSATRVVLAISFLFAGSSIATGTPISVAISSDGAALADEIVGPGITSFAVHSSYTGNAFASGFFSGGSPAGLGIDSGIILTTGSLSASPLDSAFLASTAWTHPGDTDLSALLGVDTYDHSTLEFDFETATGNVEIVFAFLSEEYTSASYRSDDGFAAFVDGVNIAHAPLLTSPVSASTVNGTTNSAFFTFNSGAFGVVYDGVTGVFTARASGLAAGTHTLKLVVADAGDRAFDSAVLIRSIAAIPEPGSSVLFAVAVAGLVCIVRRRPNRQQAT